MRYLCTPRIMLIQNVSDVWVDLREPSLLVTNTQTLNCIMISTDVKISRVLFSNLLYT